MVQEGKWKGDHSVQEGKHGGNHVGLGWGIKGRPCSARVGNMGETIQCIMGRNEGKTM